MDEMRIITRASDDHVMVQMGKVTKDESIRALMVCLEKFYKLRPEVNEPIIRVKLHNDKQDGPLESGYVMVTG